MAYTAVWWRIPGEVLTEQYISMVRIIRNFYRNNNSRKLIACFFFCSSIFCPESLHSYLVRFCFGKSGEGL